MSAPRKHSQAGGWPRRYDTAAVWREIAPHFTDAECESMATKERARIIADAPKFAALAEAMRSIELDEIADHAKQADEHGVSFAYYTGTLMDLLKRNRAPDTWATVRAEYEAALAAERAAYARYDEHGGDEPLAELERYKVARVALMACPAPDVAALAFKIAHHPDAPDFEDFDLTLPDAEAWRSIHRDALALANPAPTHPDIEAEFAAVYALGERANNSTDQTHIDEWAARDDALLARVEALPCTPENARVKALAVAHIHSSSGCTFPQDATTDVRLAAQVVVCIVGGAA